MLIGVKRVKGNNCYLLLLIYELLLISPISLFFPLHELIVERGNTRDDIGKNYDTWESFGKESNDLCLVTSYG
jgi:hypothetical protein